MKILLDLDGVLCDFVGGMCKVHNRKNPYFYEENLGEFRLEKIFGITKSEFWTPVNSVEFWLGLDKMYDADDIVDVCIRKVGLDNIGILSSPSLAGESLHGKKDWVRKHYPFLVPRTFIGSDKKFLAHEDVILIDDKPSNVAGFIKEGGDGLLLPRPWNPHHMHSTIPFLERFL